MIQIEEREKYFVVLLDGQEIGCFDTEKEAKEFAIEQINHPILEE